MVALLALGLALVVATLSWRLPGIVDAERALFGLRYSLFIERARQDDRIVQIAYTDETLRTTGKRSPLDRQILAKTLAAIDDAGAKAIGIDILIDTPQAEDAELQAALHRMKTPVVLAGVEVPETDLLSAEQAAYARKFAALADNKNVRLGNAKLQTDTDGVLRRWPLMKQGEMPLMSLALADAVGKFRSYSGPLRYRASSSSDQPLFASFPIDLFTDDVLMKNDETRQLFFEQLRGRYVLIGANLIDVDQFDMPFGDPGSDRSFTSGLDVQSHMLAQVLDDLRYDPVPAWVPIAFSAMVIPLGLVTGLFYRRTTIWSSAVIAELAMLIAVPFGFQAAVPYPTYGFPAFGLLLAWFFVFGLMLVLRRSIVWEQGKVAQLALTRYLPPDIAQEILNSPSKDYLSGDRRMIFTLFTDLEGFTSLCQRLDPAIVAALLNDYLERLSRVVIDAGGTIDKYVGDALVAIWGAPLSKEDDGMRAYQAALKLYAEGEAFRADDRWSAHDIGRTRVGLHYGEAIVGNFGGKDRVHYTALGDTINVAARLEGANKELATKILVSGDVVKRVDGVQCRPMGSIVLRGRDAPIIVFEPAEHMTGEELQSFSDLYRRSLAGDPAAWAEMQALSARNSDDAALALFVKRMAAETRFSL
ncbi:MAG: adenylate/guanylate cyclase domain-containing protein [Sphingopyxis sp.]|nr:adenylate/guanylate cyclase domain-containing protein [Sphingopyxis sp.]